MQMGHEIGLHIENGFTDLFNENAIKMFKRDRTILENIIDAKIQGVSTHEPSRTKNNIITDKNLKNLGLSYQAYSPIFVKNFKYISDSGNHWREGCMCEFIKNGSPKLCILTHPIWWYDKSSLERY